MAKRLRDSSLTAQDLSEQPSSDLSHETAAHTPKYVELDVPLVRESETKMHCSLPPHKSMKFASYSSYEEHYNSSHTNRCSECQKNLPSAHFLDLHLTENHDPIVAAKRDRGEKTFACFVEDCDKICLEWTKRRSHLVDKHGFPKNYDFFIVNNGIDGRRSMLRPGIDAHGHRKSSRERRGSSATVETQTTEATSVSQRTEETAPEQAFDEESAGPKKKDSAKKADAALDEMTKSMSSLQFVPRSVTFGKRKGKAGFAKS